MFIHSWQIGDINTEIETLGCNEILKIIFRGINVLLALWYAIISFVILKRTILS